VSRVPGLLVRKAYHARGKIRTDYRYDAEKKAWRGPVERRDPRHYQRPSVILARCLNRWCALWIATDATRCPHCHERQTAVS
jgi:hypothetical protein